jgi:pimeloyl-ACP methyl ester carboxylesterase
MTRPASGPARGVWQPDRATVFKRKLFRLVFRLGSRAWPALAARVAARLFARPLRVSRPESERVYWESARRFRLTNGIAAYEWGAAPNPLILLVHGWNGRGTQLGAFAEPLVQAGFRVVALDGPAHGESPGTETDPAHFGEMLFRARAELAEVHAVIAHSFGAGASMLAASRGLDFRKMVLIAGPCAYERILRNFCIRMGLAAEAEARLTEILRARTGIAPHDLNVGRLGAALGRPGLVVHDEDDPEVPFSEALAIQRAWPAAQLLRTQGLRHRRVLRDPEVVRRVVEFLRA